MLIEIDERDHATILAALRFLQGRNQGDSDSAGSAYWKLAIRDIASNCDTFMPMEGMEIERLCERINCVADKAPEQIVQTDDELGTCLVLSTGHVTQEVAEKIADEASNGIAHPDLPMSTWNSEYGFWVSCHFLGAVDQCLVDCIGKARGMGCEYILFDRDGPHVDGLPTYEW